MRRWWYRTYLDPHDLWVGCYWKWGEVEMALPVGLRAFGEPFMTYRCLTIYVCILPCVVFRIQRVAGVPLI